MKTKFKPILCAIIVAMIGAVSVCVAKSCEGINTCSIAREYAVQSVGQLDGMFFSSRGVVDNICYGNDGEDGAYYLIYDDLDAGMDYEAVRVSKQTYDLVVNCREKGTEVEGTLQGTKKYETVVYELKCDEYK